MDQKKLFRLSIVGLSIGVLIVSCQKVDTTRVNTTGNATSQSVIVSDELTLNNEFDQAADDAIAVCCNPKTTITGAIIDTSQISTGLIVIDYYGNEPDGTKKRTGSIAIQQTLTGGHPLPWGTSGATISITFGTTSSPGYEVFFLTNNTSISLTGNATLTNIYGGNLQNIASGDSLVERIRASIAFTYNDNASVVQLYGWNLNLLRSFTNSGTILSTGTRADTTIKNFKNVASWGKDRYGDSCYTSITATIVQNISNLNLSYNPLIGNKAIENITEPILSTYGVNNQGSPQASGTPYGFSISWINNGGQAQAVVGYYY
jgi:hypothetical protein